LQTQSRLLELSARGFVLPELVVGESEIQERDGHLREVLVLAMPSDNLFEEGDRFVVVPRTV
jgi:hypothetical protein